MMDREFIKSFSTYHNPQDIDPQRFNRIREKFKELAFLIFECSGLYEKYAAFQQLELCLYHAIASIAIPKKISKIGKRIMMDQKLIEIFFGCYNFQLLDSQFKEKIIALANLIIKSHTSEEEKYTSLHYLGLCVFHIAESIVSREKVDKDNGT